MKRWSIIITATLVATWLVVDTVREFFANETVQYFASEPHRLIYVVAIAIAGGFATLGFTRLSPRAQQHVRVFAWGAAASGLTVFVGYLAIFLSSLSSLVVESDGTAWIALALILSSGIAAYLWFEFYLAWKAQVSR